MLRDWKFYVDDIAVSCRKIGDFTTGLTLAQFTKDEKTYDAVVRNLEIIGEAAKHIPEDVRQQLAGIDWRNVAGMRNILAHAYFGIDDDLLWDVVQNKVPELAKAVEVFLKNSS